MATILNDGKTAVAKRINGVDSVAAFVYMALGTDNTAESATQTGLIAETSATGLERAAATTSYEADYKAKWVHAFTNSSGATVGIWEIAILNAASAGTGLLRHVYGSVQNILDTGSAEFTAIVTVATS